MPDPRPVEPRRAVGAADVDSLVALGIEEPPPVPSPPGPPRVQEPPAPPVPVPDPADEATLHSALAEAGVSVEAADTAAVRVLAALDTATVEAVARWVKSKKKDVK
jgi:hypothetical protein